MNSIILTGRATAVPELKYLPTNGKEVATVTIAVDRPGTYKENKKTDFIRCVVWGKKAEYIANYLGKGRLFSVRGFLIIRDYLDKSGAKKFITEVVCDDVEIIEYERSEEQQPRRSQYLPKENSNYGSTTQNTLPDEGLYSGGFYALDDDDVPF